MENKDREIQVYEYGKIRVADYTLLSKPLGDKQLIVKVDSSPLNPSDFYHIHGMYAFRLPTPYRAGFEGLGVIEAAGGEQNKHLIGKPCLFVTRKGAFANRVVVERIDVYILNDQINLDNVRKNFFINPLTAIKLIEMAKQRNAAAIIHTAASSNVGKWLTVLAKRENIVSIAVIRNEKQTEELKGLGADAVINTSADNYNEVLSAAIKKHKPGILFDALCGNKPVKILEKMPEESMLVCYGGLENFELTGLAFSTLFGRKIITSFMLGADTLEKLPHSVTEEEINKLYGLNVIIKEELQYVPLEQGDILIAEWPKRKARLVIRP